MNNIIIKRTDYLIKLKELLANNPVVALIGPRQVGKTTLAHILAQEYSQVTFFDLENPQHVTQLMEPMLALQSLNGLVIIDEIQHAPDLFKVLRVLADRPERPCQFLVLGSASPILLNQSSESLAGRIAYVEVNGFSLDEVGVDSLEPLWLRGAFPRSFLASSDGASMAWRQNFTRTFLERDLPQLGIRIPAMTMRRFWMMLAHYHGQTWNAAEFARAFGVSDHTVRHYLDILTSTFIVKQLQPWWENISKRQIKSPKIYLNDTGILHALLGLDTLSDLAGHPKVGASWEGFAIDAILNQLNIRADQAFFWGTHSGAELDLFVMRGNQRLGFEFKRTLTPKITRSLQAGIEQLQLTHAYVVYAGDENFPLATNVTAVSLKKLSILNGSN